MDLLYSDGFGIHQWFLSRTVDLIVVFKIHEWIYSTQVILASISGFEYNRKPCGSVVNPREDLLHLGNSDFHQGFLSRIELLLLYCKSTSELLF